MMQRLVGKNMWIALGSVAMVIVLLVLGLIVPLHKKIAGEVDDVQRMAVDREIKGELMSRLPDFRQDAQMIDAKKNQLVVIIDRDSIVLLIEEIESLADKAGVDIAIESKREGVFSHAVKTDTKKKTTNASISDDQEQSGDSRKTATPETVQEKLPSQEYAEIVITLTGTYGKVFHFIRQLETMPYFTDVLSMDIQIAKDKKKSSIGARDIFSTSPPASQDSTTEQVDNTSVDENNPQVKAVLDTVVYVLPR